MTHDRRRFIPGLVARSSDVASYPALFRRVKETLLDGQRRIESEKVRTYWQTGQLIQTHILKNKDRADYGTEVVVRLSQDLQVSPAVLHRCVKFFQKYPDDQKVARAPQFTWSHYQELLSVADDGERARLEDAIRQGGLTRDEIRARKRADRDGEAETAVSGASDKSAPVKPLVSSRGLLYTYKIIKPRILSAGNGSALVVDLGFSIVRNVPAKLLANFSAGDVVESFPNEEAYAFRKGTRTPKDLYTYRALVERVVDGDTMHVSVDLGFDTWVRETLRLRGIDCPELGTKDGEAAKAFVQSLVKEADTIVIRSFWSDKYGRYLVDVFLPGENGADVYLSGLLLEKGFAERYE